MSAFFTTNVMYFTNLKVTILKKNWTIFEGTFRNNPENIIRKPKEHSLFQPVGTNTH
jgi:hypothetical protein